MKIRFLGGANEVGASSTIIELDDRRILVDAGIRMGPGEEQLPIPEYVENVGIPDAVLVTHAHADHTGALPVLSDLWQKGVKLYWPPVTKDITQVMLKDSVKRMEEKETKKGITPLYRHDDLDKLQDCMDETVQWLKSVQICDDITATWIPAAHILGAAMIYIQGKSESILMTGDVSLSDQLTIPGLDILSCKHPDVMVMESTYGDREHKYPRHKVERRLAKDVHKVVSEGGKVLIPTFAIGRAQEVILILKQAMERKEIPEFPVYVDGMVTKINEIYSSNPSELSKPLQKKSQENECIFYSQHITPVKQCISPESVLTWDPCCIVASSGMLNGGKSSIYAKHLATDPKNMIAIVGYQGVGTPGRVLYDWVSEGVPPDNKWKLNDELTVHVQCDLKKYSLSAHADSKQLLTLVEKVQPGKLFLVHGGKNEREELYKSMHARFPEIDVKRPKNGKTYSVNKREGIANGRRLPHDRILEELSVSLRQRGFRGPFSVYDIAEHWFGSGTITSIMVKFFEWILSLDSRFFISKSFDKYYLS